MLDGIGRLIARYLQKPVRGYEPFTPSDPEALRQSLQPGDVLLVEGNNHISGVIKYLTQSTWSHSALYVGPIDGRCTADGEPHVLIEANVGEGVVSAPLSKYFRFHTRICRPVGLTEADCATVCAYAIERIGFAYDLKNIIDLMRYLFPLPMPQRWRRRMIALGSGDPSRLICSALIADAFRAVRYPILPKITLARSRQALRGDSGNPPLLAVLPARLRHFAVFQRRQADDRQGFDYKALHWADLPAVPDADERRAGARAAAGGRPKTPARSPPDALVPAGRGRYLCLARGGSHARRRSQSAHADSLAAAARGAVEDRSGLRWRSSSSSASRSSG